jgi:transposase InsO family protein
LKYAFIARQSGEMPVRLMCQWLDVSASGFYASLKRRPSKRSSANARLKLEIRAAHQMSRRRYGAIKIHNELKAKGTECGHNRVAKLMREEGIRSKRPKAFRITTKSDHRKPVAENHLERRFGVGIQRALNRVWVADITYLPTREGWLYLSIVMDLASRRIVGWRAAPRLDQGLALRALEMAIRNRSPLTAGMMHHSDRGSQYASDLYQATLESHGIKCSMSRKGDCWDNAVAESFFATLKTELVIDAHWESRSEAKRDLFEYIENWYNCRRRHASLGYQTPAEYEIALLRKTAA